MCTCSLFETDIRHLCLHLSSFVIYFVTADHQIFPIVSTDLLAHFQCKSYPIEGVTLAFPTRVIICPWARIRIKRLLNKKTFYVAEISACSTLNHKMRCWTGQLCFLVSARQKNRVPRLLRRLLWKSIFVYILQWLDLLLSKVREVSNDDLTYIITKNAFCGTWYLLHNERTVPIIMAGCIAHARTGRISTSGEKYDVTIVFHDPYFLKDAKISAIRP